MKIKKEYIGSKVFHPILRRFILIEEGSEERYKKLGLDIFITPNKPKLQKNAKNTERRNVDADHNSNGVVDNNES